MSGPSGPKFPIAGEGKSSWHHLTLTVSPSKAIAEWNRQSFTINDTQIRAAVDISLDNGRKLYSTNPFMQTLEPTFDVRGGLGLYVFRGSASFCEVVITPIPSDR